MFLPFRVVFLLWGLARNEALTGDARSTDPWEHVIFIGVGAYAGNLVQNKHHENEKEVEELRLYLERRTNAQDQK